MLKKLRERLAELRKDEADGVEERSEFPGALSRAEEIEHVEGQIRAYERLADLRSESRE